MAERSPLTRREALRLGLRATATVAVGGLGVGLASRSRSAPTVWQIDPDVCVHCERCSTHCVLTPSAVKCVHAFDVCGYCTLCGGFHRPGAHQALAAAYGYDVTTDPDWPLLREARELKMVAAAVPLLASSPGVAQEFHIRLDSVLRGDTRARWTPFADLRR